MQAKFIFSIDLIYVQNIAATEKSQHNKETLPLIQETTQKPSKYLNMLLFNVCDENEDDLSYRISLYSSQKYSKIFLTLYTFLSSLMYIYTLFVRSIKTLCNIYYI